MREFKTNIEAAAVPDLVLVGGEFGEASFPNGKPEGYKVGSLVGVYQTGDNFSLRAKDPKNPPRFGLGS